MEISVSWMWDGELRLECNESTVPWVQYRLLLLAKACENVPGPHYPTSFEVVLGFVCEEEWECDAKKKSDSAVEDNIDSSQNEVVELLEDKRKRKRGGGFHFCLWLGICQCIFSPNC